jgi:hypothetical protein
MIHNTEKVKDRLRMGDKRKIIYEERRGGTSGG